MNSNTRKSRQSTNQTEEVTVSAQRGSANFGGDVDGSTTAVEINEYSEADAALAQISDTGLPRWLPTSLHDEYEAVLAVFEQWGLTSDSAYGVDVAMTVGQLRADFARRTGRPIDDERMLLQFASSWNRLTTWQEFVFCQLPIRLDLTGRGAPDTDPVILFRELPHDSYHRTVRGVKVWAILARPRAISRNPKTGYEYGRLTPLAPNPATTLADDATDWIGVAREFDSLLIAEEEYEILRRALRSWRNLPKDPVDLREPDPIEEVTFGEAVARAARSEQAL